MAALVLTAGLAATLPASRAQALALAPRNLWRGGAARAAEAAAAVASGRVLQGTRPRLLGARALRGHERRGVVAFTFDDGPHRDTTPRILTALAAHEVPAAFFVCGYQIDDDNPGERANARVLDAAVAAGHLIGNHTFFHTRLEGATRALTWSVIDRNERVLAPHLGGRSRLFRPPYGKISIAAARLLADLGYTVVRWSIDPDDHKPREAHELSKQVIDEIIAAQGGVVILHDTMTWTARAMPSILAGLERENCRRIARGLDPILPVSLDYFASDASGLPLPLAPEVEAQTQRTRAALDRRCSAPRPVVRPN